MSRPIATVILRVPNADGGVGQVISGVGDPTSGAGVASDVGTMYIRTDEPELYVKRESPDWGWWRSDGKPPWSWDSVARIGVPATATEWDRVIEVAGLTGTVPAPIGLWLFQETEGNLADSIGAFTLAYSGSGATYQQPEAGWSRRSIGFPAASGQSFANVAVPSASSNDLAAVLYARVLTNGGANQKIAYLGSGGGGINTVAATGGTPQTQGRSGGNVLSGSVSTYLPVRPYGLISDRTNSRARVFTDVDKVSPTFSTAVAGQGFVIGGGVAGTPAVNFLYGWLWGVAPSDANTKLIMQTLGWNILWT